MIVAGFLGGGSSMLLVGGFIHRCECGGDGVKNEKAIGVIVDNGQDMADVVLAAFRWNGDQYRFHR
jgi:hypothetical protein